MTCPSCGTRRARRACPALGQTICPVCCATKRLTEIRCPATCQHLATARAHPAAAVRRQHEADLEQLMGGIGRLSEGQLQLFFLLQSYFLRPAPPGTPGVVDSEVADAAGAVAGTLETASRGVIFEHDAASPAGRRMAGELLALLADVGKGGGSRFEREASAVLRAIERAARPAAEASPDQRSYLDLVARVLREGAPEPPQESSHLVLP